ncbi:uncharacterized protein LOC129724556 [Wyeomyia smithii]|uniref:uncharacterized protein LOC129724556 n=1 Tax=Wyeomyia smithii TaxID=174621 RepID=UPI0024682112|nr:uncharacterized protein LOC129724556 [Wyeomyia smithii]
MIIFHARCIQNKRKVRRFSSRLISYTSCIVFILVSPCLLQTLPYVRRIFASQTTPVINYTTSTDRFHTHSVHRFDTNLFQLRPTSNSQAADENRTDDILTVSLPSPHIAPSCAILPCSALGAIATVPTERASVCSCGYYTSKENF